MYPSRKQRSRSGTRVIILGRLFGELVKIDPYRATAVRTTGYSIKASRSNVYTRRYMMRLDASATQTASLASPMRVPFHRPVASRRMHACRRTQLASLIDFAISVARRRSMAISALSYPFE